MKTSHSYLFKGTIIYLLSYTKKEDNELSFQGCWTMVQPCPGPVWEEETWGRLGAEQEMSGAG